jgi:hypothetical protein
MKNLFIILVIFLVASVCYSQTFNAPVPKLSTLSTKVITPFSIWDATENTTPFIEEVIIGQKRILNPAEGRILFQMKKETNYTVYLSLGVPNPVDNVLLTAHWFFNDSPPPWSGDFPGVPLNSNWNWYDQQTDGWITIKVTEIDATNTAVTTGIKTFKATATGLYTGL